MSSEIASTSAVHVSANDHRTMNALTEWINSSSICDSENLSWLEHPLCHLLLVEVLVTDRVGGWVWRHVTVSPADYDALRALVRGPRGGWGSETPYTVATHLTDSLLAPICIHWNPSFVAAILFSALHFAYLRLFDSERIRSETRGTVLVIISSSANNEWSVRKCLLTELVFNFCLLNSFTTCKLNFIRS